MMKKHSLSAPADQSRKCSFAPVIGASPRVLILGSMPGDESLRQAQYYAHPRNAFWRILGEICNFDPAMPYAGRLEELKKHRIALWDTLSSCRRPGSLDSSIVEAVPNDLPGLLAAHPTVVRICCNGTASYTFFRRCFPELAARGPEVVRLPSTSPAAAGISYERKLAAFRAALEF